MSELDAALAVEPKQPVRTERNFALTKGIAGAVRLDLNGEVSTVRTNQISAIIAPI